MAQSSRHVSELTKRDVKGFIVWLIGCHTHVLQGPTRTPIKVKNADFEATYQEIKEFLKNLVHHNDGRKLTIERRTLYRYLEQLRQEGFVEQPKQGIYTLTEKGMKHKTLTDVLLKAGQTIFTQERVGAFFSLGPKENGRTKYLDILVHVQDPVLVEVIRKSIAENKVPENDIELGRLLSTTIMWYFKGILSRIPSLMEGKEDLLSDVISKLPINTDKSE